MRTNRQPPPSDVCSLLFHRRNVVATQESRSLTPKNSVPLFTLSLLCSFLGAALPAHAQVSLAWATRFGSPNLVASPVAMTSDSLGNIYATGNVSIISGSPATVYVENLTIKY